jgi:hypothetical protein
MRSSERWLLTLTLVLCIGLAGRAQAQQAQGFAVDRFYPSAPGAGWLVMNALDSHGGIGGSLSLTLGYARNPLHLGDGDQQLRVISDQAVADLGGSITYERFRVSMNVQTPVATLGQSGTFQGYLYSAPVVDLSTRTDLTSDLRVGVEARLLGAADAPFRLGVGAQLYFPNGSRADDVSDGTYRGMLRLMAAGDAGAFTYAGHLGLHIRPVDEPATPGSPRRNEALYGLAAGGKLRLGGADHWIAVIGPELFGATALKNASGATALEGLISARVEGTRDNAMQTRVKLGLGGGLIREFGAPDVRVVLGVEVFSSHN